MVAVGFQPSVLPHKFLRHSSMDGAVILLDFGRMFHNYMDLCSLELTLRPCFSVSNDSRACVGNAGRGCRKAPFDETLCTDVEDMTTVTLNVNQWAEEQ